MNATTTQRVESGAIALGLFALGPLGFGFAWWWPLVLFLIVDLSAFGYLAGPRVGARVYNAGHSYVAPVLLAAAFALTDADGWMVAALAWAFHVAVDRALGYGLKLDDGFQHTHLGWIGRGARDSRQ